MKNTILFTLLTIFLTSTSFVSNRTKYKKHFSDAAWAVYTKPITLTQGDSLYVIAHRIGCEPSEMMRWKGPPQ